LFGLILPAHGADDPRIELIHAEVDALRGALTRLQRVDIALPGLSAEGGTATAYFEAGALRFLTATLFGESGKTVEEYFYRNQSPLLIVQTNQRYNAPIMMDAVTARELGTEAFDPAKTVTGQDRYYFENDHCAGGARLIRWLDPRDRPADPGGTGYRAQEAEQLLRAAERRDLFATVSGAGAR